MKPRSVLFCCIIGIYMTSIKWHSIFPTNTFETQLKMGTLGGSWVNHFFIYLFICWSSRMVGESFQLIMSHSLLWRHIVLLTVGVYSSNHRVLYTIGLSMTRRFQKSVGPSVCPFVTLTKKKLLLLHY